MKETTNAYFRRIYEVACAFQSAKAEREKEKEALIAADDWDAVHDWYEREKSFEFPFPSGQMKAYWAWRHSSEIAQDILALDDFLWEREVKDFCRTLREAGLTEFAYTNRSTAVMENIHAFESAGWRMAGTWRATITTDRFGGDFEETVIGLRFEIEKEG